MINLLIVSVNQGPYVRTMFHKNNHFNYVILCKTVTSFGYSFTDSFVPSLSLKVSSHLKDDTALHFEKCTGQSTTMIK